ncbi:MAG: DUF4390 domain-containing protein [bacterium]|nr:DUF4390 domain-containing protein [bacterium]
MSSILFTVSFIILQSGAQNPNISIVITQSKKEVFVNLEIDNLFTYEILEGINRGFTSCIEYTVDLWWDRALWLDQLIQRKEFAFFINYNLWDKEYKVTDIYGAINRFTNFTDVLDKVCVQPNVNICATNILDINKTYYVAARIVLKPLVTEDLNEMLSYAMGEIREARKKEKTSLFTYLIGQARNFVGLGDKVITGKSEPIKVTQEEKHSN